ncbi:MAG: hypothetical protein ACRCWI_01430 [Brevinema sp.]
MAFGAGILYFTLMMQIMLGIAGQASTNKQVILEFELIQDTFHTKNQTETTKIIPQVFDIIMKEQVNYASIPHTITRYQITPSNVIVFFDEKNVKKYKKTITGTT